MIEDLNIPVMHDDQRTYKSYYIIDGTAVVCLASIINGLKLMKKKPNEVKLSTYFKKNSLHIIMTRILNIEFASK